MVKWTVISIEMVSRRRFEYIPMPSNECLYIRVFYLCKIPLFWTCKIKNATISFCDAKFWERTWNPNLLKTVCGIMHSVVYVHILNINARGSFLNVNICVLFKMNNKSFSLSQHQCTFIFHQNSFTSIYRERTYT